jgi:DNA-binding response OmpR family regulator
MPHHKIVDWDIVTALLSMRMVDSMSFLQPLTLVLVNDNGNAEMELTKWGTQLDTSVQCLDSQGTIDWTTLVGTDPPDLFLVNETIPGGKVVTLVETIRAHSGPSIPLFILSDTYNSNLRDVTKAAGANGWLDRPVDKEIFVSLLDAVRSKQIPNNTDCAITDFVVKLGFLELRWDGNRLHCGGVMDEHSHFERLDTLLPSHQTHVDVMWNGLKAVNIAGVKAWQKFITSGSNGEKVFHFYQCPAILIEYIQAMGKFFGDQVVVETACFPSTTDLESELHLETTCFHFPAEPMSIEWGSRNILHATIGAQEKGLPEAQRVTWFGEDHQQDEFLLRYLGCFAALHRQSVTELLLTRDTVLDQWSRLCARLNAHNRGMSLLLPNYDGATYNRRDIVDFVLKTYAPTLHLLIAVQNIIHYLCIKASSRSLGIHDGMSFSSQLARWEIDEVQYMVASLQASGLLEQDKTYSVKNSLPELKEVITTALTWVRDLFSQYHASMETHGRDVLTKVIGHANAAVLAKESLSLLRKFLPEALSAQKTILVHQEALMSLEIGLSPDLLAKKLCAFCADGRRELNSIMTTVSSHDEVSQFLEHRIKELDLVLQGAPAADILQVMQTHAVTLVEKQFMNLYFPELGIEDQHDQELDLLEF